jgi:hypothetical protein
MRIPRLLSKLWLRMYSDVHETVDPKHAVGIRTLVFTPTLATTGTPVYRELNQAQYDKAISDKHIHFGT